MNQEDWRLESYDYDLPQELIAQQPADLKVHEANGRVVATPKLSLQLGRQPRAVRTLAVH